MVQNYCKESLFPKGTLYYFLDCYIVGVAMGVRGGGRMSNTFRAYVKGLKTQWKCYIFFFSILCLVEAVLKRPNSEKQKPPQETTPRTF